MAPFYLFYKVAIYPFLLLSFLAMAPHAVAQTVETDSLKNILNREQEDTNKVILLNEIANLFPSPDSSMYYGRQALTISRSIDFKRGEAVSLNRIANAFTATGNYPKSLELHLASLKTAEIAGDEITVMNALSNISNDYTFLGNLQLGVDYLHRAITLAMARNDKFRLARYMVNMADSYEKLNRLDSARYYCNRGYDLSLEVNDEENIGIALANLGNIYTKMKQYELAIANYNLSINYFIQQNNDESLCEPYLGKAAIFRTLGATDSSLFYAKRSLLIAQKGGYIPVVMRACSFLTDYYISRNNVDSAFVYQSKMIAAKDTMFNQEKQREIQSLTFDEAMRQQQLALDKLKKEKHNLHNIQFAIMGIAIVTFLIVFFLLSHTVLVNEKWIKFLGILGLLLFFEFLNLFIHPYIADITDESPFFTLIAMVIIASFLIPFHHRIEHFIKVRIVDKNKKIRLAAARQTLMELEDNATAESDADGENLPV